MKDLIFKLSFKMYLLKEALQGEQGQDLIEYALVVALIAFAATAAMTTLATDINGVFTTVGSDLNTAVA